MIPSSIKVADCVTDCSLNRTNVVAGLSLDNSCLFVREIEKLRIDTVKLRLMQLQLIVDQEPI